MPDELESDIQATAEDITADAGVLQAIEAEKAGIDPTDPRALDLATQAERLARDIVSKTVAERELVAEALEGPTPEPSGS
jgi:putative aminopeptidase FrvX